MVTMKNKKVKKIKGREVLLIQEKKQTRYFKGTYDKSFRQIQHIKPMDKYKALSF